MNEENKTINTKRGEKRKGVAERKRRRTKEGIEHE